MRYSAFVFGISLVASFAAYAQNSPETMVRAQVCEPVLAGESKASARVRATDKASFKAVEDIPALNAYREGLDSNAFNLKVYRLIDNYLEDLKISVTEQNSEHVCVSVSAFLFKNAVKEVFETSDDEQSDAVALEVEALLPDEMPIAIPPKPEIIINQDIAYSADEEGEALELMPVLTVEEESLPDEVYDLRTKVFVDKTEFYNGTETDGFFEVFQAVLARKPGIRVLSDKNNPDYILKPKILKAKVDSLNTETGRLQIIVSVDLTDVSTSQTLTEHQNRFVLFNQSDDAHKEASRLARKLFEETVEKILPKIKTKGVEGVISPSVITPNS